MSGSLLLGIDIGTASTKGVLCTPDGTVLDSVVIAHETSFPRPGWAEHDADALWWAEVVEVARQLTSGARPATDVGAVAVSAIGPCVLPVSADGRPLRPAILYGIDTRATAEGEWLTDQIGANAIVALSGMALNSQTIGPKIRWLRNHEPERYARTAWIHSASDYITFKLTGEHVMDYHTASYYAPLFNIETLAWDSRYADLVIDLDRLPRLGNATDIAGGVTARANAETGLPIGTPVTFGTIDAAAEAVSVGVQDPGDTMAMYGSTMFFLGTVAKPKPDARLWTVAHPLPGRRAITAGLATAGLLATWFLDVTSSANGHDNAYPRLIADATETPPGADGLICLPYFAGERTPIQDPDARGIFAGLTLRHTRAHLFRALLEGIAFAARHNLDVMREMNAPPTRLIAVGGGTRNPLWLQVVSDITGLPQAVPERAIGASLGDAFLAGLGTGIIPDLAALDRDWVRVDRRIEPNPANAERYDAMHALYLDLYEGTKDTMHRLGAIAKGL